MATKEEKVDVYVDIYNIRDGQTYLKEIGEVFHQYSTSRDGLSSIEVIYDFCINA